MNGGVLCPADSPMPCADPRADALDAGMLGSWAPLRRGRVLVVEGGSARPSTAAIERARTAGGGWGRAASDASLRHAPAAPVFAGSFSAVPAERQGESNIPCTVPSILRTGTLSNSQTQTPPLPRPSGLVAARCLPRGLSRCWRGAQRATCGSVRASARRRGCVLTTAVRALRAGQRPSGRSGRRDSGSRSS